MNDPLEKLERWERSGGHWRVTARTGVTVTVALLTCDGGEQMELLTTADSAFVDHLAGRDSSEE